MNVQHKFVDFIPDQIENDVLYLSLEYGTVIHKCACGCGNEVNTPLSPTGWKMIYDGERVTLKPSIGNWSFDCKSHYWITNNKIEWSSKWNEDRIQKVRETDDVEREEYYRGNQSIALDDEEVLVEKAMSLKSENKNWLYWIEKLIFWK